MPTGKNPSQIQARPKILWLDDDRPVLESAVRLLRTSEWDLITCADPEEAERQINRGSFAVVISDHRMVKENGIEFLAKCRRISPRTTRILITGYMEAALLKEAVNTAGIFRFISKPWEEAEILRVLELSVQHHIQFSQEQELLRRMTQKNHMLEELRSGLEQMVLERTRGIEESKNEVESKQTQIRGLVKFIKNLSEIDSRYELLQAIRKDLRRIHEFAEPLFFISNEVPHKQKLIYLRAGEVFEHEIKNLFSGDILTDSRQFLANELGRPVNHILVFPLHTPGGSPKHRSALFVEHQLPADEIPKFLDRAQDRMQPIGIVLDRITLGGQLKSASLQWERTFDAIQDPVAIVDLDYKLLRANRHFFKGHRSEFCHRTLSSSEQPCSGCPIPRALEITEPSQGQVRVGSQYFEVYSYPIQLRGDSHVTTVVNHYVDVTDKRELYTKMIQNEKMAALGHLAGSIAHELNNPLTGLRSLSQVIKSEVKKSDAIFSDLDEVEKAAARCQLIITNLLSFSKHSETSHEITVSLNQVVESAILLLKTAMRAHNRSLELSEEPVFIKADPNLLQQVVFNLVNNACQAMREPGTVSIVVKREGDEAVLYISDTGVGIPPENLERVFEPFFTTKPEGEGTGIGLSMSRSIVESFGGKISLESQVGKGSTFCIRFKIVKNGDGEKK